MLTQCPACNTVFRVRPEHLAAAHGKVRCGECQTVFNGRDHLRNGPGETGQADSLPVAVSQAPAGVETEVIEESVTASTHDDRGASPTPAAPSSHTPPREPRAPLDLFLLQHPSAAPRRGRLVAWTLILVLLLLLPVQYLYFNRQALSAIPALRPATALLCRLGPCDDGAGGGAFELTGRQVQSHPAYEGALLIDATFVNRGSRALPYPTLELVFTDIEGNAIASRRFRPREYLGREPEQTLAPGAEGHVILEVLDPGNRAVGYEFRFF